MSDERGTKRKREFEDETDEEAQRLNRIVAKFDEKLGALSEQQGAFSEQQGAIGNALGEVGEKLQTITGVLQKLLEGEQKLVQMSSVSQTVFVDATEHINFTSLEISDIQAIVDGDYDADSVLFPWTIDMSKQTETVLMPALLDHLNAKQIPGMAFRDATGLHINWHAKSYTFNGHPDVMGLSPRLLRMAPELSSRNCFFFLEFKKPKVDNGRFDFSLSSEDTRQAVLQFLSMNKTRRKPPYAFELLSNGRCSTFFFWSSIDDIMVLEVDDMHVTYALLKAAGREALAQKALGNFSFFGRKVGPSEHGVGGGGGDGGDPDPGNGGIKGDDKPGKGSSGDADLGDADLGRGPDHQEGSDGKGGQEVVADRAGVASKQALGGLVDDYSTVATKHRTSNDDLFADVNAVFAQVAEHRLGRQAAMRKNASPRLTQWLATL